MHRLSITPYMVTRFILLCGLFGYYIVVSNPTPRSITTFYNEVYAPFGVFVEAAFPFLFVVGIFIIVVFGKVYPYTALLIGAAPQYLYAALSAGWYFSEFPDVNPAALFTHLIVTGFILNAAWGAYYDIANPRTIST